MWATNLKIVGIVLGVLALYTLIANKIPQVQSEVPQALALGANVTPEQLVVAGEKVYNGIGGCTTCHGLGTRAPNLLTDEKGEGPIGARCGKRKPGMECKAYLYESLTEPAAYVVKGYAPIMADQRRTLSPDQIWAVIAFLQSNGGDVTVTGQDIEDAQAAAGAAKPAAAAGPVDAMTVFRENCATCHKIKDEGGEVGPKFDGIGSRQD